MAMTQSRKEMIVGAVFAGALTILLIFTVIIKNYNPFEPPKKLWVFFRDVGGLREGDRVRIAGLEVGQVDQMRLTPRGVLAKLVVQPEVELYDGYEIKVRAFSPLGGKYVDVERGNLTAKEIDYPTEADVEKNPQAGLTGNVEVELISELADLAESIKKPIIDTAENLKSFTGKLNEMEGTLGKLVGDPTMYEHLVKASANLSRATGEAAELVRKVNEGSGTLAKLVNDPRLYDATAGTMERMSSVMAKVDDGKGVAGALVNDEGIRGNLERAAAHIESILAAIDRGEGTAGRIIRDERLYENLAAALEDVRRITTMIAEAKGPLGVLLNDEKAGEDLRNTIAHLERVTDAIASGKGTVGRLIMDDRLITEAERVIVEMRESVEDLREQAPINAFVTAVFQAF